MRLVTDEDDEKVLQLADICDLAFDAWQRKLDIIDSVWDDVVQADSDGHISESVDLMMQAHAHQGESIRLWYEYIQARKEYIRVRLDCDLGFELEDI